MSLSAAWGPGNIGSVDSADRPDHRAIKRAWRASRCVRFASAAAGGLAWLVAAAATLFADADAFGSALAREDEGDGRTARSQGSSLVSVPADLAVSRLSGDAARRQPDLRGSLLCRWRGIGAFAAGTLDVSAEELRWTPNHRWAKRGARDFLVKRDSVVHCDLVPLFPARIGVTLLMSDASDVWIEAHGREVMIPLARW